LGLPGREEWVEVVECYYDDDGKPRECAKADLDSGDNVSELRFALIHALAATYEPAVKASEMKEE